jgi:cation diffusion facilitator family transporter
MSEHASAKEKAALWSIAASAVITLGKGFAGLSTGSLALISDAAHSLLDVAATIFTYFAVRAANKPADDEHPYGHGKVESLAALGETAFLFVLSGAVAFAGIRRLVSGETAFELRWFAVVILLLSIVIDAWRWRGLTKVAKLTNSQALAADALHFSSDLINSVLVLLALLAAWLGYPQADSFVAVGVAVFIALAGFRLARNTIETLLDAAPRGAAEDIRRRVDAVQGVVGVEHVRVRSGGAHLFADIEIGVARTLPLDRLAGIKERIAATVAAGFPGAQVTVTAAPRALDEETVLERVLLIAAKRRTPVHHVTVQTIGDRLSVSLDIEVDGRMSLGAAHAIATKFETALKEEFGAETEVDTHIEPLVVASLAGRDVGGEERADIAACLARHAAALGIITDVHSVRVRQTGQGLVVNYHCRVDPALRVESVHDVVDRLEQLVRADVPQIARIVSHTEPIRPAAQAPAEAAPAVP